MAAVIEDDQQLKVCTASHAEGVAAANRTRKQLFPGHRQAKGFSIRSVGVPLSSLGKVTP